jgi:hypothetical protein
MDFNIVTWFWAKVRKKGERRKENEGRKITDYRLKIRGRV